MNSYRTGPKDGYGWIFMMDMLYSFVQTLNDYKMRFSLKFNTRLDRSFHFPGLHWAYKRVLECERTTPLHNICVLKPSQSLNILLDKIVDKPLNYRVQHAILPLHFSHFIAKVTRGFIGPVKAYVCVTVQE